EVSARVGRPFRPGARSCILATGLGNPGPAAVRGTGAGGRRKRDGSMNINTSRTGAGGGRAGHDPREFGQAAPPRALGAPGVRGPAGKVPAATSRARRGIKLCAQSPAEPTDDQLLFLRQIGAAYVSVAAPPGLRTAEGFLRIKKRYADAGIEVWNIGNSDVHNMPEVTLNLPGRH